MTRTKLKHAIAEAERFLRRAKELEREGTSTSKQIAATKRASMDLTRALADLRRMD